MAGDQGAGVQPVPRDDWLALRSEAAIDPELPIIDPHHHFIDRANWHYGVQELSDDIAGGHNIRATIHVETALMYHKDASPELAPLGETEYVAGLAAKSESGQFGPASLCAGIIAYVDLRLGSAARDVIAAHLKTAGPRLKGIRNIAAFHSDPQVRSSGRLWPRGLLADPRFRQGVALLPAFGLPFDTFLYHTQIDELTDLAQAFPDLTIVLNHAGGPLGIGPYEGRFPEVHADWRQKMSRLAREQNVFVKIGGLGMKMNGFKFDEKDAPPASDTLVDAWHPYIIDAIEIFGPRRCMFESNFPVDRSSCSYTILWNAFKKMAHGASPEEKDALFFSTAASVYRLHTGQR